jgi:hypothetical protein
LNLASNIDQELSIGGKNAYKIERSILLHPENEVFLNKLINRVKSENFESVCQNLENLGLGILSKRSQKKTDSSKQNDNVNALDEVTEDVEVYSRKGSLCFTKKCFEKCVEEEKLKFINNLLVFRISINEYTELMKETTKKRLNSNSLMPSFKKM